MFMNDKNWIKFMLNVAMACTAGDRPEGALEVDEAAAFIRDVLHIALDGQDVTVTPISYPVTTKAPLKVVVDNGAPKLFWYYPSQSWEVMSDHLADLVLDLTAERAALATA